MLLVLHEGDILALERDVRPQVHGWPHAQSSTRSTDRAASTGLATSGIPTN